MDTVYVKLDDVVKAINQAKTTAQKNATGKAAGTEYQKFFEGQVETCDCLLGVVQHESFHKFNEEDLT